MPSLFKYYVAKNGVTYILDEVNQVVVDKVAPATNPIIHAVAAYDHSVAVTGGYVRRGLIWCYTKWFNHISIQDEIEAEQIIEQERTMADEDEALLPGENDPAKVGNLTCPKRMRNRYQIRVSREVKGALGGVLEDNAANRKIVAKEIFDTMRKHGVRKSHIQTLRPMVIELVLTPDEEEIRAHAKASSKVVKTAKREYATNYTERGWFKSWFDRNVVATSP